MDYYYALSTKCKSEPQTYQEAINSANAEKWQQAI